MADIKFCENNFSKDVEDVMKKLKEEGIDYEVEDCLGYCDDCVVGPIATIDDELVTAETLDELYEEIIKLIEQ